MTATLRLPGLMLSVALLLPAGCSNGTGIDEDQIDFTTAEHFPTEEFEPFAEVTAESGVIEIEGAYEGGACGAETEVSARLDDGTLEFRIRRRLVPEACPRVVVYTEYRATLRDVDPEPTTVRVVHHFFDEEPAVITVWGRLTQGR